MGSLRVPGTGTGRQGAALPRHDRHRRPRGDRTAEPADQRNRRGTATHLGRYTATYEAVAPLGQGTATGNYVFTAATGDRFTATFAGSAAPVEPGVERFTEVLTIVSGTGRFAGATGTFTMRKNVYIDIAQGSSTGSGTMEGEIDLAR